MPGLNVKILMKTYTQHFALDEKLRIKAEELFSEYMFKMSKQVGNAGVRLRSRNFHVVARA